jgi:hypothetical protein
LGSQSIKLANDLKSDLKSDWRRFKFWIIIALLWSARVLVPCD